MMMRINPILRNEMKTDSRRFRFYLLLMLYVALLGIPVLLIYHSVNDSYRVNASNFTAIYMFLACMQAIILMFVVPALTSNAITSEREKQTLDILLTTKMTPRSIIWGKLLAAVSKVILLIVCAMPIYAIVLFLGGIRISHIISINLYLMVTTVFVGAMCIWVSTIVKTSKFANVVAYFIELGFIIGVPIGIAIWFSLTCNGYDSQTQIEDLTKIIAHLMCISPAVGYGDLLGTQLMGQNIIESMFGRIGELYMPGWLISVSVEVVFTILFLELAIRQLNPLRRHRKCRHLLKKSKTKKLKKTESEALNSEGRI